MIFDNKSTLKYKELRSHNSVLTISKTLKETIAFLRSIREVRPQDKPLAPEVGRQTSNYRESRFTEADTSAGRRGDEPELESTPAGVWRGHRGERQTPGMQRRPHFRELPPGPRGTRGTRRPASAVEETPVVLPAGAAHKAAFENAPDGSVRLDKACPQVSSYRTHLQRLNQNLTYPKESTTPSSLWRFRPT